MTDDLTIRGNRSTQPISGESSISPPAPATRPQPSHWSAQDEILPRLGHGPATAEDRLRVINRDPRSFLAELQHLGGDDGVPYAVRSLVLAKQYGVLKHNERHVAGHQITLPSPNLYHHLWLWDSAFHAQALASREPQRAKNEMRAVFAFQREDGMVPHESYFEGDGNSTKHVNIPDLNRIMDADPASFTAAQRRKVVGSFWLTKDRSDITQPPILAQAVEEIFRATGDRPFMTELLPKLIAHYDYLHDKRDFDGDGLVSILHPWESGWDQSQRWDEAIGVKDGDTRDEIGFKKLAIFAYHKSIDWDEHACRAMGKFDAKPVDFNTLYAINMQALARLCHVAGDEASAQKFNARAEKTINAIREKMWDGDKYVDLFGKGDEPSAVKSAAMFYPLLLDDEPHAYELIENHLANPNEFNVDFAVPTTSVDSPRFQGDEYWRGNVWLNVNTFIWQGLQKVLEQHPDFTAAQTMAVKIERSSFALLATSRSNEFYNPRTGRGNGPEDFGWNVMVYEMGTAQQPSRSTSFQDGIAAFEQMGFALAALHFEAAARNRPEESQAQLAQAKSLAMGDCAEEAIDILRAILETSPHVNDGEILALLTLFLRATGEQQASEQFMRHLGSRDAGAAERLGRLIEAIEDRLGVEPHADRPDTILALGSPTKNDGSPLPRLLATLNETLRLANAHPTIPIIVSGGAVHSVAEAPAMKRWLVAHGVEPRRITVEDQARDTIDNMLRSAPLMKKLGTKRLAVVSAAYHLQRSLIIADGVLGRSLTPDELPEIQGSPGKSDLQADAHTARMTRERFASFRDGARASGIWKELADSN